MTSNSVLIENVTPDEFTEYLSEKFRQIVRDELSALKTTGTVKFLTRFEVADLLKISLPTLNEYTRTGIIKGSRIGSRVLYAESDIKEAIKNIPAVKYKR